MKTKERRFVAITTVVMCTLCSRRSVVFLRTTLPQLYGLIMFSAMCICSVGLQAAVGEPTKGGWRRGVGERLRGGHACI